MERRRRVAADMRCSASLPWRISMGGRRRDRDSCRGPGESPVTGDAPHPSPGEKRIGAWRDRDSCRGHSVKRFFLPPFVKGGRGDLISPRRSLRGRLPHNQPTSPTSASAFFQSSFSLSGGLPSVTCITISSSNRCRPNGQSLPNITRSSPTSSIAFATVFLG